MSKPDVRDFSHIAPIIIEQYQRYLPSAFDDSLTMLEKVNKVIQKLNEIGQVSNGLIDQWNDIIAYVLGEGMTDAIQTQLDQMVSDGTFDNIINNELLQRKATIIMSETEPTSTDNYLYWYQDMGDSDIDFNIGEFVVNNATVADTDTDVTTPLWFDIIN